MKTFESFINEANTLLYSIIINKAKLETLAKMAS